MMGAELDTTEEHLGHATTEANVKGFYVHVQMLSDRTEYQDKAKRVGNKLQDAFNADPDLYRAFSYLVSETSFAIVITPKEQRRIITP